ncbi:hypothetical protein Tco_1190852 [Tanacetum coccineum]
MLIIWIIIFYTYTILSCYHRISTSVFVDPKSSTEADGAQSFRVLVPLPKDPYEAIRQAYLDGTDTESDPFEDPIDTEAPELPLTIALPISLSESTLPVLVPILPRTARMAVRLPHAMSSGLSASMEEVAAMSESAFRKRFRSSCESSPSVSPPDLSSWKCYREDEDPAAEDEGLTARVEGLGMDDESYGLDDEGHSVESDRLDLEKEGEVVPGGQQQTTPVVGRAVSAPLGLGYGELRRRELALEEDDVYSTFEVGQGSGSAPEF